MKNTLNTTSADITSDLTQQAAWIKTSQFIQEKYGKKIEFRFLNTSTDDSDSNSKKSFTKDDDLIVPLKYKKAELGQVIVCRGATLTQDQQLETVDLIQFLIEPQAYNRMLKLQISSATNTNEESNDNVIRLFSKKVAAVRDLQESGEDSRRRLVSKFIHVKAKSSLARHKVALKIHEMTGTIVFLRLQDLTDGKTELTHEMDLTDTAIYVDNISELNQNQLRLLERLSRKNMAGNSVVIVGSSLTEDQIQHFDCSLSMKNDLLGLSYDADRVPVSQQASEEILDLLFFNDDDIIS
jgi:hypothetical protein